MEKEILARRQLFEQEITTYSGDDPLKLRFDFLMWLENTYGKTKCLDTFNAVLDDTLNSFCNDKKYSQDNRFIQLLIYYAELQKNPLEIYTSVHSKGIGTRCSSLYISWANEYFKLENYKEVDRIMNLGLSAVPDPKEDMDKCYREFLETLGKKYLQGQLNGDKSNEPKLCAKCSASKAQQDAMQQANTNEAKADRVLCWEFNSLKIGEPDNFACPIAIFEPEDPTKKPMYPKKQVYAEEGKEYSPEEIKARNYAQTMLEREKKLEMDIDDVDNFKEEARGPKSTLFTDQFNSKEKSVMHSHTQSFGEATKLAINVVQELWKSPSSSVIPSATSLKVETPKVPFEIYDENQPPKPEPPKSVPFSVYTEDSLRENAPPSSQKLLGSVVKVPIPKAKVLSDRKLKEFGLDSKEKSAAVAKQQLAFGSIPESNAALAEKVEDVATTPKANPVPMALPPGFEKLAEADMADDTCNTKAFAFVLPSSTPVHKRKSMAPQNIIAGHDGSFNEEVNDPDRTKPVVPSAQVVLPVAASVQDLSVILEASKERYSSSSSSNSSSNARTPGVINRAADGLRQKGLISSYFDLEDLDPFSPKLTEWLLTQINFPLPYHKKSYFVLPTTLPKATTTIKIGNITFNNLGEIGKGAYARVLKVKTDDDYCALKIEKPPCKWEYYIAKEIQQRVEPKMRSAFLDIHSAFIYQNGSILQTEYAEYGTLLSVISDFKLKTGRLLDLGVVLHFAIEMFDIIDTLHKAKIIHGDIKPDNFVVRSLPGDTENHSCIKLIDFGRCIDMTLLPERSQFKHVVTTDGFQCNEMKENKPWTYQTDLYGLAGSLHCLLVGTYMKVVKKNKEWKLHQLLPRNMRRELWDPIFAKLLNINSCDKMPDLIEMRMSLQKQLSEMGNFVSMSYNSLNILRKDN